MEDAQESQAQEMIYIGVASLQSAVHEEQAVLFVWLGFLFDLFGNVVPGDEVKSIACADAAGA
jgi:hypothetical protein